MIGHRREETERHLEHRRLSAITRRSRRDLVAIAWPSRMHRVEIMGRSGTGWMHSTRSQIRNAVSDGTALTNRQRNLCVVVIVITIMVVVMMMRRRKMAMVMLVMVRMMPVMKCAPLGGDEWHREVEPAQMRRDGGQLELE